MVYYAICGLTVASDIPLPAAAANSAAAPDVRIACAPAPSDADRMLLRVPEILCMHISRDTIHYALEASGDAADIAPFVLGSAFPILLHRRRSVLLRASGVAAGGHAMLFAGPAGSGKSTLAAALTQQGRVPVADDIAVLGTAGALVHREGRPLQLWADAVAGLNLSDRRGARVRPGIAKYRIGAADTGPALPLGAIYTIDMSPTHGDVEIVPLDLVTGAMLFRQHGWRPELIGPGVEYLRCASAVARSFGMFRLQTPPGLDALHRAVAALDAHWHSLDIGGTA